MDPLQQLLEESTSVHFLRCDRDGRILACSRAVNPAEPGLDVSQFSAGTVCWRGQPYRVAEVEDGFVLLGQGAAESDQLKAQFLANISHEFRTPLNAVLGMAQLMQKTSLNLQQREYLRHILGGSQSLARLVNDILDFSAIDAGRLELRTTEFQLETLSEGLLRQVEAQARPKGLKLIFKLDPEVPTRVVADPMRLQQLLLILLENAVKFTARGQVSLRISRLSDRLVFLVSDSGPGMSREVVSNLFTPFAPGDGSLTRAQAGAGLGLALCRQLVELMKGEIRVESRPGQGSHFTVTLPFTPSKPALEFAWESSRAGGPGERVLVVEDNLVNQLIVCELLQSVGLQVDVADNGREALQKLESAGAACPWRIVLMDLQMPEMDGYTAARAIRAQSRFEQLPILAMTAHVLPLEQQLCRDCGMDGFLAKPVDQEAWFGLLSRWLPLDSRPQGAEVELAIEGVDTRAGIQRCAGNVALYRKLLLDFGERGLVLGLQLSTAAHSQNWPRVAFLAHALRGEAGNLGVEALSARAGLLQNQPHQEEHLAAVVADLQSLAASLPARLEEPPPPVSAEGSAAEVAAATAQLREHLQNSQGDAVDSLERFLRVVPAAGRAQRLRTLVHQFEFSEALLELEKLLSP